LVENYSSVRTRILFIINPISGGRDKKSFPALADRNLDLKRFEPHFLFSKYAGHAAILARQAVEENLTDIIIAVGGDGTINEAASVLEGTGKILGIVPCGSGNGLARSLHIPMDNAAAVRKLNEQNIHYIDTAVFNNRKFFNMAGMGFDAHISSLFARKKVRGLAGYAQITFKAIARYKPQTYTIEVDGSYIEREAFMISIANSSQFGNNAHVAPHASLTDGFLDVSIIKPFPLSHFPVMGWHMFAKTAHKSRYVEIIKAKTIRIIRQQAGPVHLDGEPEEMGRTIDIQVKPLSLAVLR